jgi:hypothetical protein
MRCVHERMTAVRTVQGGEAWAAYKAAKAKWARLSEKHRLYNWKYSAKCRGLSICIADARACQMFWEACAYCGKVAVKGLDPPGGIDRPNSFSAEYREPGSAVPCCSLCNIMKASYDPLSYNGHALLVHRHVTGASAGELVPLSARLPAIAPSGYAAYVRGAQSRGYSWSLSEQQFAQLTAGDCCLCGAPGPSTVDRIDNFPEYEDGKVQSCC